MHLTNKKHWELANNPNDREKASFLKENFSLIQEKNKLRFIEEGNLYPNIEVRFFHGHTAGQMIPIINIKIGVIKIHKFGCIDEPRIIKYRRKQIA